MTPPTSIREAKWRELYRQVSLKLDAAEARTDFRPTLELARRYRGKLEANNRAILAATDHPATRAAHIDGALATFGVNGLWPAICDVESQSRFHGRKALEMKHG